MSAFPLVRLKLLPLHPPTPKAPKFKFLSTCRLSNVSLVPPVLQWPLAMACVRRTECELPADHRPLCTPHCSPLRPPQPSAGAVASPGACELPARAHLLTGGACSPQPPPPQSLPRLQPHLRGLPLPTAWLQGLLWLVMTNISEPSGPLIQGDPRQPAGSQALPATQGESVYFPKFPLLRGDQGSCHLLERPSATRGQGLRLPNSTASLVHGWQTSPTEDK